MEVLIAFCLLYLPHYHFLLPAMGVKRKEPDVNHQLPLAPRLKKEYRYTSIPHRAFMDCSRVNVYRLRGIACHLVNKETDQLWTGLTGRSQTAQRLND